MNSPNEILVEEISVTDLFLLMEQDKELLILDVRTPEEYEEARVKRSINIPMDEIEDRLEEVKTLFKDKTIYFFCRRGIRSFHVTNYFVQMGFKNVYNIAGGITAWKMNDLDFNI